MKNLKDDFMRNESHPEIKGKFVICLTTGHNFLCDKVWRMKTNSRNHFRFYCPGHGERRFNPDETEFIIEIQ